MFPATNIPAGDYISPNFQVIMPDPCFPNITIGDPSTQPWPYLRREIPHNWYVDGRQPYVGFLSRDEAHILYNTALQFAGKPALEIGCWLGWSACHLALAGVHLDVVDPLLEREDFGGSVTSSLTAAGVIDRVNLVPGFSPAKVTELFQKNSQESKQWSLIFIDGNHEAPGPVEDAIACAEYAAPDALILFHDLASPDVSQGLDYLKSQGWQTMVYQTMQIMGVAWRGNVQPVQHIPDPSINWPIPAHLQHYEISGIANPDLQEFRELLQEVRPFTLLSEMRLYSLYTATKQICLQDLPGNFVECGACKGGASAMMAAIIKHHSQRPRKLFAFDTFAGMPEPTECDRHQGVAANDTGFGVGTLSAPIAENIARIAAQLEVKDILEAVPGLFKDTLPVYSYQIGEIALLHADGDWYESTMDIFNNLYDAVVLGGTIQIDDYGHWEGCRLAVHDFAREHNLRFELEQIDYTGVRFVKQLSFVEVESLLDDLDCELRDINILVCPDWTQPEDRLKEDLSGAIAKIITHPQSGHISLLVDTTGIDEDDASLMFSGVFMDILMEEEVMEEEVMEEEVMEEEVINNGEPNISFIGDLEANQWQALLSQLNYRLPLKFESKSLSDVTKIQNLPFFLS